MIRTALFTAIAILLTAPASAQSVHTLDGTHETLGQFYFGRVLYIQFTNRNNRTDYATAIRYNDYFALTAAHVATAIKPGTTPIVGTGSSPLNNPGSQRSIVDWGTHPTWAGVFNGTAIDLAWLRFDAPLPGPVETITGSPVGMGITIVGFGRPATPAGYLPFDRERRAIQVVIDQNGNTGFGISTDFSQCDFLPLSARNMPMAGVITTGNSGSPGYGSDGTLKTMALANAGAPFYNSSSFSLRLIRYRNWIDANTIPPCLPDLNGDGIVDNGDIGAFVAFFLAGNLAADFNADGILDNGDIGTFVAAFLAGC